MMSLLSRLGSWIMGSTQPEAEHASPSSIYNPSLSDIQHVRRLLRHFVPTELANMILHHARYYHVLCAHTSAPHVVCDLGAPRTARPILSITIPRHEDEVVLDGVLRLEVTVRGHDEDWSGSPVDKDTKRSAWTWYSLGTADPRTHEEQLATNLHAVPQTQTHGPFVWGRDSPVMLRLKEDRQLELWAHAEFPGWANHVEYAEMLVTSFPS